MMNAAKKKKVSMKKAPVRKPAAKKTAPKIKYRSNNSFTKYPRPSLVSTLAARPGDGERLSPRLQAVVDKSEISDVLTAFARGIDRVDENLLRSVLHPDATLDLGPGIFQGTGNDYVHWVLGVLNGVRSSHHMLTNLNIDMEGDTALVECY